MSAVIDAMMRVHVKARLQKMCRNTGGGVSAGALAKHMHISRGTAQKYLSQLVGEGVVIAIEGRHVNNQTMISFYIGE